MNNFSPSNQYNQSNQSNQSNQLYNQSYNQFFPQKGNYQTAFNPMPTIPTNGYDPKANFKNNNFNNDKNLLHNNLTSNLLHEEIREYSVMIDSKDRNYQIYPDPFCYEVKFRPLPRSKEKKGSNDIIYEDPAPTINDSFKNVKYIKLEAVALPFYNKIIEIQEKIDDDIVYRYEVNKKQTLTDELYTVLSIGDFNDANYKSTNDVLSDSFSTIYFNKKINNTHFSGQTSNGIKYFPQDQLGEITKFKINFMDPYGNMLKCSHLDKNIKSGMECTCEDSDGDDETTCFKHNIFHPLNPIFQHHLHFKVGVLEPRLKKLTFN